VFFGGKGGVGKTTCAAAAAVAAARSSRVLVVSTDPAHSLSDVLAVRLGSRPRSVAGAPRLDGVELDAARAFRRWLTRHGAALGDVLEHGTWLDREDVDALLELSVPGIDELIALIEVDRLARQRDYDLVIVDTAPTGHTLRLLSAPDVVAGAVDALDALQEQHRIIRTQLARVGRPDAGDRLIAALAEQAHEVAERLRDPRRSAFHWVLLPEELSVAESEDAIAALGRARVHVSQIVINRVMPDGPPCPICDRRRADERRVIAQIPRRLGRASAIRTVESEVREPRGVAALGKIGHRLAMDARLKPRATGRAADRATDRATDVARGFSRASRLARRSGGAGNGDAPPEIVLDGADILLFAGKGGVGKTTCAAAAAIRIARRNAKSEVVLLSTDPAHSLGDVFGVPLDDRPRRIAGAPANLSVREVDAAATLRARRETLEAALNGIASTFGSGDPGRGVTELLDLAPPGIDELLGMLSVAEMLPGDSAGGAAARRILIVDMAPTGHALRLLEMPEVARAWIQSLMRVLLKYRPIAKADRLGEELVDLSKSIRRLHERLRDPVRARVVVVTRAARVPRLETERLLDRLRQLKLGASTLVVNAATLVPGACPRCRAVAAVERRERLEIARACRRHGCAIILSPLVAPAPCGGRGLDRWAGAWRRIDR
jgi:arsenite/tail-anchored protein-transporting ATPase